MRSPALRRLSSFRRRAWSLALGACSLSFSGCGRTDLSLLDAAFDAPELAISRELDLADGRLASVGLTAPASEAALEALLELEPGVSLDALIERLLPPVEPHLELDATSGVELHVHVYGEGRLVAVIAVHGPPSP